MAKVSATSGKRGAPASKPAHTRTTKAKGKPGSAAAKESPRAEESPSQSFKPTHAKPHGGDVPAAATTQVTKLVARMKEKSLPWYEVLKPLRVEPAPAPGKKSKKKTPGNESFSADSSAQPHALDETEMLAKKAYAQRLLENEVARHESQRGGKLSSDDKYLATMMQKGTLADRVAAVTLTIQSSPFHSLSRVAQLISMANKKARRESIMAVDSLKDLFINNLLPDDRKLKFFHQNALDHAQASEEYLVVWFFEHCLKTAFAQLVGVLSSGMSDAVDNHKRACIRAANALLTAKPEQEAVLLGVLVNKMGDPDRKVASYIHKTLQDLLREHPLMKRVVVDEVERLLTRSQVSERTKYNAVLFLNQILLRRGDPDDAALAGHLIKVYFALFSMEVHAFEAQQRNTLNGKGKKGKPRHRNCHTPLGKRGASSSTKTKTTATTTSAAMDRKLLSALLMGVNRAFPYSTRSTSADLENEIQTLFTVARMAEHFLTSVQALVLLFQVMNATHSVSDRFYSALYEKLFDPKLRGTSKHTLLLNLVFKAIKADVSPARACALIKRLLQLTSVMPPAFACAVLFLLSEVFKVKPQLRMLLDQPAEGVATASAAGIASDDDEDEEESTPNVFNPAEEVGEGEEEEEEEEEGHAEEKAEASDGLTDAERTQKVLAEMFGSSAPVEKPRATKSFVKETPVSKAGKPDKATTTTTTTYDWTKRNPLYAGAETSCAWELHHLLCHYHPSVQVFARQLVANDDGAGIRYAGDPLVDFTMHAFFEKFMNKKPRHREARTFKQSEYDEVELARNAAAGVGGRWAFAPMNTEAVLQESPENVDASDQFFYKFFKERASREAAGLTKPSKKKLQKKKAAGSGLDADALSDVEEDDDEDEELEAFAQELAEGIMQDGDMDDEDVDMDDWNGGEDAEEGGAEGGGDDSDDEALTFGGDDEDEEDEDGAMLDGEDDDDDEDGLNFGAMGSDREDESEEEKEEEASATKAKTKSKDKAGKRSAALFADADDYETIMREALTRQEEEKQERQRKQKERQARKAEAATATEESTEDHSQSKSKNKRKNAAKSSSSKSSKPVAATTTKKNKNKKQRTH